MNATNTDRRIDTIVIDDLFTYESDNGFQRIYRDGNIVLNGHYPYSKMVIAAACEIEEQRRVRDVLNQRLHRAEIFIEPRAHERPTQVFVENRKYEIQIPEDASSLQILRYGDSHADPVENYEFFYALATALHNARRDTAHLASELIEAGYTEELSVLLGH